MRGVRRESGGRRGAILNRRTTEAGAPVARRTEPTHRTPKPAEPSPEAVRVEATGLGDVDAATARTLLRPTVNAALAIRTAHRAKNGIKDGPSIEALVDELSAQCQAVTGGNMSRAEALLTAQAHTLDTLFGDLVRRAYSHSNLDPFERIMRLALKVQSQSRATVESLAVVKNPPIVFAKQANVTTGPQQVNNGMPVPISSRAREIESEPIEQMETHGANEWLDRGATSATVSPNSAVEAVGAVNRSAHDDGEG